MSLLASRAIIGGKRERADPFSPLRGDRDVELFTSRFTQHSISEEKMRWVREIESLDYETCMNEPFFAEQRARTPADDSRKIACAWFLTLIIGLVIGALAFGVLVSSQYISEFKYVFTLAYVRPSDPSYTQASPARNDTIALLIFLAFSMTATLLSSVLVVFVANEAAGSGVPLVKAYLNGSKVRHVLNIKVLIVKLVGLILAQVGGLFVGKEGPLVHVGAAVGSGFGTLRSRTLRFDTGLMREFNNDRERRDFVAIGSAAGIAAAFGAPIGGVLFAMEETSSFWSGSLTWRTFFGCMISSFTLNFFQSGVLLGQWGSFVAPGLVTFEASAANLIGFEIIELVPFAFIGITGGLLGALFNGLNRRLTFWRETKLRNRRMLRLLEVSMLALVTSIFAFFISSAFPCVNKTRIESFAGDIGSTDRYLNDLVTYGCSCPDPPPGGAPLSCGLYNDMATLMFATQEEALAHLFSRNTGNEFDVAPLLIFMVVVFLLTGFSMGSSIPCGLWLPCMLMGASLGRMIGHVVALIVPQRPIDAGTYALVGAAAVLTGVTRMTIALTVILLEMTSSVQYLLPIILTISIAKWFGDVFNHSLYDSLVDLKNLPYLPREPPFVFRILQVRDSMATPVIKFRKVEAVRTVLQALADTRHNAFPIVHASEQSGGEEVLEGIILRTHILRILTQRRLLESADAPLPDLISWSDFSGDFFRIEEFKLSELKLSPKEMDMFVDLGSYMNQRPYSVHEDAPLERAFLLFRTVGLRHLCVVDLNNRLVGMLTRKDLLQEFVQNKLAPEVPKELM